MFFSKKKDADNSEKVITERPLCEDKAKSGDDIECPLHTDIYKVPKPMPPAAELDTETSYPFINFFETRKYLQRVKGCKERLELLQKRESFHWITDGETESLKAQIEEVQQHQMELSAETADEISKLDNVKQEMVMTLRYIDCLTWEEIAKEMDLSVRTVQKLHGRALPAMEKVLLADGKIDATSDYHGGYRGGYKAGYHDGYHGGYNRANFTNDLSTKVSASDDDIREGYFSD